MRRHVMLVLVTVDMALAVWLAAMWVTPQGAWRNVTWQPPAPVQPEFGVASGANSEMNLVGFVAALDRPLFSPSRRPPPVKAVGAAAPVDPLANIQLHGIYAGSGGSGIIATVDGKSRRIRLNESVGEWAVKSIVDRDVTFTRGDEVRVIHLARSNGKRQPGPLAAGAATVAPAVAGTRPAGVLGSGQQLMQERMDRLNARGGAARQGQAPAR
jgi:hypothetical protein